MIYLIDDNKIRQVDSGWDDSKLDKFKDYICPIYKLNDFTPDLKVKLFKGKDNVILFHESFFDNIENRQYKKDVNDIRNSLTDIADDSLNRLYVSFSGSNSERKLDAEKISGSIPVHILYQNLHVFIEEYRNQKKYNLDYLLYGSNIEIEPQLLKKLNVCKNNYIKEDITFPKEFNNYFFYRSRRDVNTPFKNFSTIFNTESENGLDKKIKETLKDIEFKGIFVPLCFGQTLSDFNGLRLATHIRCTPSKNQLKKIFIYSFVRLDEIIDCEYFNILKTKNVYFIDYRKKDFLNAFNDISEFLKPDELSDEIKKVKLEPPLNYADPHSIANEWAIYQWAKTIGCDKTDELAKVFQNVETNLYFKYLQTINPISEIDTILNEDLNIEPDEEFNNEHEDGTKVLLIDDEAEKGWHEIFAYLLGDLNKIYIDYLGDDFKNQSGEEIIDRSIQKIKDEDIDVVILDFRLNFNDFIGSNPKNISSIRLLEKIKAYNPGIQVIIFSATNKIWNLQTLQNAGADGFVFKGIHEWESNTTPVESMVNQINLSIKRVFLKELFQKISLIKKYIFQVDYVDDTDFEKFILGLITDIKIIEEACQQINLNRKSTLDIVFLSCYNLLEQFKSYYICYKDYSYVLGIDEIDMVRYSPSGKKIIDNGVFTPNNQYDKPSWFNSLASISIDYLQICNLNDGIIKKLAKIKNERNDFIHGKKTHFDQNELKMILNIIKVITKGVKE